MKETRCGRTQIGWNRGGWLRRATFLLVGLVASFSGSRSWGIISGPADGFVEIPFQMSGFREDYGFLWKLPSYEDKQLSILRELPDLAFAAVSALGHRNPLLVEPRLEFLSYEKRPGARPASEEVPGQYYVTRTSWTGQASFLVLGDYEGANPISNTRVTVLDRKRIEIVGQFRYANRTIGSSLDQILTHGDRPGYLGLRSVARFPSAVGMHFVQLDDAVRSYLAEHPDSNLHLRVEFDLADGKIRTVPIADGTAEVTRKIRPGLLGRWHRNYRSARREWLAAKAGGSAPGKNTDCPGFLDEI